MIEFHLDKRSGVAPYQQVVQQVRHALRLGLLKVGDQLPTVKEVVTSLAINPNTVLKAYKELENLDLVAARVRVSASSSRGPCTTIHSRPTDRCARACDGGWHRREARASMRRASRRSFATSFGPPPPKT